MNDDEVAVLKRGKCSAMSGHVSQCEGTGDGDTVGPSLSLFPVPMGWDSARPYAAGRVPSSKEQARPQSSGAAMTSPGLPQPRVTKDNRVGRGPVLSFRQHKAGEVMAAPDGCVAE